MNLQSGSQADAGTCRCRSESGIISDVQHPGTDGGGPGIAICTRQNQSTSPILDDLSPARGNSCIDRGISGPAHGEIKSRASDVSGAAKNEIACICVDSHSTPEGKKPCVTVVAVQTAQGSRAPNSRAI